jgi:hypothetical protein
MRCLGRGKNCGVRQAALAVLLAFVFSTSAEAQEAKEEPQYGWREFWAGADASSNTWLIYSGTTIAPWSDIYSNGWRFRLASGYGQYTFESTVIAQAFARKEEAKSRFTFTEALAGYHLRLDPLTVKAFAGYAMVNCNPEQPDIINRDNGTYEFAKICQGSEDGMKGALELWLNIGDKAWSSLDVGYTTAHETGSARVRAGYRVLPTVSIGPELIYNVQEDNENIRAGLFARYEWFGGEISAAAGLARDYYDGEELDDNPYANINLLVQY